MRSHPEVLVVDHPLPWLRYVDAAKITAPGLTLNGMKVRNDAMETLGSVEGFIVDNTSMRPYYVVVDSGGWFKSNDFLVPIGHVSLEGSTLTADLTKDRVKRFPGFDKSEFEKLSADDLNRMNAELATACCADGVTIVATAWETGDHYRAPVWWKETYYRFPAADRRG